MTITNILKESYAEDDYFTHTSMIKPRGKFYITRKNIEPLFNNYELNKYGITEKPDTYSMLRFDFDIKRTEYNNENRFYSTNDLKVIIDAINQGLQSIINIDNSKLVCCLLEKDIYLKSAEKKIYSGGFHLQYPWIFMNQGDILGLIEKIKKGVYEMTNIEFDSGVYRNPWLMYGSKKDEHLKPYILTKIFDVGFNEMTQTEAFSDYPIFNFETEDRIELNASNIPQMLPRILSIRQNKRSLEYNTIPNSVQVPTIKFIDKPKKVDNREVEEKLIESKKLLSILKPSRVEEYADWMTIGWCLFSISEGCEEGLELWDNVSKLSEKYDDCACEREWSGMKIGNYTLGTLHKFAREDDKKKYDELFKIKKEVILPYNDSEDYCWTDFVTETREPFDNLDTLLEFFRLNFPRVAIKINMGKTFYLKKEHSNMKYNPTPAFDFEKTKFYYIATNTSKKGKTVEEECCVKLDWVVEKSKVTTYSHVVCNPQYTPKHAFNIWQKMKGDIPCDIDMNLLQPVLDYIKINICSDNDELYKYIISWLRHTVLHPHQKTGKTIVLQSLPGSGKSMFTQWLIDNVFGTHCANSLKLDDVSGKFNSLLLNKVFVVMEELPVVRDSYHHVFDTLKDLVTGKTMSIQYKGKEPMIVDNLLNFWISSNHERSIKIDTGDRRYVVIKVNESHIGQYDWFANIAKTVLTEQNGIQFFNYLCSIPDGDERIVSLQKIPDTEIKQRMKDNSMNSIQLFLKDLKERDIPGCKLMLFNKKEVDVHDIPISESIKIHRDNLYISYVNWCAKSGEKVKEQRYMSEYFPENLRGRDGRFGRYYIVQ
jgi:hypothetical protein